MRRHANFVVVNARHYRELESGNDPLCTACWRIVSTQELARSTRESPTCPGAEGRGSVSSAPTATVVRLAQAAAQSACAGASWLPNGQATALRGNG